MSEEKKTSWKGRPREYDREAVAEQMIEWAKREDSMNLLSFNAEAMIPSTTLLRWVDEDKDFRVAYEMVRDILGAKREKKLAKGELHVKAYDLNSKVYDRYLKKEHRENYSYETKVKSEATKDELNHANLSDPENWQKKVKKKDE